MVFMTRACELRRIAHITTCVLPSETTKWERVFANREKLRKLSKLLNPMYMEIRGPIHLDPVDAVLCL